MFKTEYAIYLGKEDESYLIDFVALENFFLIIELVDGEHKEDLQSAIEKIKSDIVEEKPSDLDGFSQIIEKNIKSIDESETISLACGLVAGDILYLLTRGGGQIYLDRQGKYQKILEDKNTASGYIKDADALVFTNARFTRLDGVERIEDDIKNFSPKELVEKITPTLKSQDDVGALALFIKFEEELAEEKEVIVDGEIDSVSDPELIVQPPVQPPVKPSKIKNILDQVKSRVSILSGASSSRKRITFVVAILIIAVLLWSVVTGAKRRANARLQESVEQKSQEIEVILEKAQDASILDREQAARFVLQAKDSLAQLREIAGDREAAQIKEISGKVAQVEKSIVRKEEKKYEEFYNLALVNDSAVGSAMFREGDSVSVLDSKNGRIYKISLTKKSVDTFSNPAIKGSYKVASYNDNFFVLDKNGTIYSATGTKSAKKVVDNRDEWKEPADFWVFNNNLYVLDVGADQIYKYLVVEGGYSSKTSYIEPGNNIDFKGAVAISIDGALYVAKEKSVYKYLSGIRQEFSIDVPDSQSLKISDMFTDQDTGKLYLMDSAQGNVIVVSKNGEYERQIDSSIFKRTVDFIVFDQENAILVLAPEGIYSVSLD